MKYILFSHKWLLCILMGMLLMPSCTDEWNKHYDENSFDVPTISLMEYIASQPELSIYAGLLKQTGYDTIIGTSQSYTVWAPNNDALSGVDLNDAELVDRIVRNHIARFSYSTSGVKVKQVYMLTGKYIAFKNETEGQYTFGGSNIVKPNNPTINGIVHIIDQYVPMHLNLWEYIMGTPGLDSLKNYLVSKDGKMFDSISSTYIGVNGQGQPIYDSVFVDANAILNRIGALKTEDSIYSMLMPSNTAWIEAYPRIGNYFKMLPASDYNYLKRQKEKIQFAIVQDLVFRGIVANEYPGDSLVSTSNNVFHSPADLFNGATGSIRSNGLSYVTDQLSHPAHLSWHKTLQIEAEADSGRVNTNSNIFKRSSLGSVFTVSNSKFIEVEPTSTSSLSKISATFPIPNTLSAKYNLYCVFVPDTIANPNTDKPGKANFYLSYVDANGATKTNVKLTVANNVISNNSMTKMFLTTFTFPYSNLVDQYSTVVKVALKVENAVNMNETSAFTRTMRIDCIILEPVQ